MARRNCFIITPIGDESSEIRRAADGVIDAVIAPVMDELGIDIDVAHRMSDAGSITKQVINKLVESDLVICNLTSLNPNVMYELAVRHAIRKPVVCIAERGTKIPFDIQEDRIVFYDNDMKGVTTLIDNLKKVVPKAETDESPDNPIYRAIESQAILKQVNVEGGFEKYIVNSIDKLERMVGDIRIESESRSALSGSEYRAYSVTIYYKDGVEEEIIDNIAKRIGGRLSAKETTVDETNNRIIFENTRAFSPAKLKRLTHNVLSNEGDYIEDIKIDAY